MTWSGFLTAYAINQFQNSKRITKARRGHLAQLKLKREKNRESCEYEEENKTSNHNFSLLKDDLITIDFVTMGVIGQNSIQNLFLHWGWMDICGFWISMPAMKRTILKTMCKETKIHEQKLIAQIPLQLSPSEENCVIENLDLFEKNGFRFAMLGVDGACSSNGYVAGSGMGAAGEGKRAADMLVPAT